MFCVLFLRRSVLLFVTVCLYAFFDGLRAPPTQYGFTGCLGMGRCVLFYFMNHMGHA